MRSVWPPLGSSSATFLQLDPAFRAIGDAANVAGVPQPDERAEGYGEDDLVRLPHKPEPYGISAAVTSAASDEIRNTSAVASHVMQAANPATKDRASKVPR